jgi:hypothetical protein
MCTFGRVNSEIEVRPKNHSDNAFEYCIQQLNAGVCGIKHIYMYHVVYTSMAVVGKITGRVSCLFAENELAVFGDKQHWSAT